MFTTRPDTLMGVTYIVLAPEHPLTTKVSSPDRLEVKHSGMESLAVFVYLIVCVAGGQPQQRSRRK